MLDIRAYLDEIETALGVKIPDSSDAQAVYDTIYTALAESFGVEKIETGLNFNYLSAEALKEAAEGDLQGYRVKDGFAYFPSIVVNTKSSMYALIRSASISNNNIHEIFTHLSDYTKNIIDCNGDSSKLIKVIIAAGIFVVSIAGTAVGIAAAIATGGAALPVISAILSGASSIMTYIYSFFNLDRSFIGLVLNDSNKDALIRLDQGDVFAHEGRVITLPGEFEARKTYIPKKLQKDGANYAFAGIYQVQNSGANGAECLIRFKFSDGNPRDIDIMGGCPLLRGNVTAIDFISKERYSVENAFKTLRKRDSVVSNLNSEGVTGHATVDHMKGTSARGVAWFEFNK